MSCFTFAKVINQLQKLSDKNIQNNPCTVHCKIIIVFLSIV